MRSTSESTLQVAANLARTVEVRDVDGKLVSRVTEEQACELIALGWAITRGKKRTRFVQLTPYAPVRVPTTVWRGKDNTQRIRNDAGIIVAPDYALEHRPLLREE